MKYEQSFSMASGGWFWKMLWCERHHLTPTDDSDWERAEKAYKERLSVDEKYISIKTAITRVLLEKGIPFSRSDLDAILLLIEDSEDESLDVPSAVEYFLSKLPASDSQKEEKGITK
jgi:hypothetical protein